MSMIRRHHQQCTILCMQPTASIIQVQLTTLVQIRFPSCKIKQQTTATTTAATATTNF